MSNLEAQLNKRMDSIQSSVQTLLLDGQVHTLGEHVEEIERILKKVSDDNESFAGFAAHLDMSHVPFGTLDNHQLAEVREDLGPKVHGRSNERLRHEHLMYKEDLEANVRDSSVQYIARLEERMMHKLDGEVERFKHSCLDKLSSMREELRSARADGFSSPEYDQRAESLEGWFGRGSTNVAFGTN